VAIYKGTGDRNAAENFVCCEPREDEHGNHHHDDDDDE